MHSNLFAGVKILDLSRVFSGPFATRHFADFGAEVIKIEPPRGDDSRHFPPLKDGWSGYFEVLNRNKQSLVLDLKNEAALQHFYELVRSADVVVSNFAPGVAERLKIDYQTLQQFNHRIIFAEVIGVSSNVKRKYYDVIAQAESGFASLNGETESMKVATSVVDAFSGMKLAFAIASALYARQQTGQGTSITVSMKGAGFDLLEQNLVEASVNHTNPAKVGNMDSAIAPFGFFKTQDGAVALAMGNDKQWEVLLEFLQRYSPQIDGSLFSSNQLRINNLAQLKAAIESVFTTMTSEQVVAEMQALELPVGRVATMLDILNDPENVTEKLIEKVEHPIAGEIALPVGGISFSAYQQQPYHPAPSLPTNRETKA